MESDGYISDRELLKLINSDKENFRLLIEKYKNLVYHMVFSFYSDAAKAEEISHDIFVKIYFKLHQFEMRSRLSTWIGRITYNYCVTLRRRGQKEQDLSYVAEREHSYLNDLEETEKTTLLHQAIDLLPDFQQVILKLYHFENLSYKEIALIVNRPEGTIKSDIYRARKTLKDILLKKYVREDFI